MARNGFDINAPAVACLGTIAKTVVGLRAAANISVEILELALSCNGNTSGNAPARVDFNHCTFATNPPGTASTSITTQRKRDPDKSATFQYTAAHTWTTEPTVLTPHFTRYVAQYNGNYHYVAPWTNPIILPGSTSHGVAITVTSPNDVSVCGSISGME